MQCISYTDQFISEMNRMECYMKMNIESSGMQPERLYPQLLRTKGDMFWTCLCDTIRELNQTSYLISREIISQYLCQYMSFLNSNVLIQVFTNFVYSFKYRNDTKTIA